jgi:protein-disulfide isomerase
LAKKAVKSVPSKTEKEFGSWAWLLAIVAILIVAGIVAWFAFFSVPSPPPVVDPELADNGHATGNPDAIVTVVTFSDFQCPACAAAFPAAEQVIQKYQGRIRFVYRHFPLISIHPFSVSAAEASECASKQGKFWEMHDSLFQQNLVWTNTIDLVQARQNIRGIAQQIGLELNSYDSCLSGHAGLAQVQKDVEDGIRFGVNATPTFFINGKKIAGALSFDAFSSEIDAALADAK